ncbi:hypothetical protein EB796_016034 [Bugula neritina]|uniref:RRM domain-containing protein n=1 Tax=Bugula neritina TaxID=10212 RepID=A0A7J7JIY6_BUGNE|nr:hypothetical protein EB796_016034 [Bugula neritina]
MNDNSSEPSANEGQTQNENETPTDNDNTIVEVAEDARKLFIGGIPPQAKPSDLKDYFSKYGEVQKVNIITDVYSGRSRGFAFLIFANQDSVNQVLNDSSRHTVAGKEVEAKLATPLSSNNKQSNPKVFVGGINKTVTKDVLCEIFNKRGNVTDVFLPVDENQENKGYAFVTFDDSAIAATLCEEGKIMVDDKECDIKKARSKYESRGGGRGGRGGFYRGRSGGRGGYDHYGADYRYGYIPHDFGYGNVYTGGYTGGYGIDNSARYNRGYYRSEGGYNGSSGMYNPHS